MRRHLNEFDAAVESYLARMAGEAVETRTRQAEAVRIHYQSKEAAVTVPIFQAMATGVFIAAAVGAVAILAGWPKPWAWALITWLLVQAAAWLYFLQSWRGIVLHRLESLANMDLNGDSFIGNPAPQPLRVEVVEEGGRHISLIDLPASEEQLTALAKGLLGGKSFGEGQWTGAGATFTRAQFVQLRTEMIRRGLAAWIVPNSPTRGARLTARGRAVCKQILLEYAPPPSDDNPEREYTPLERE